MPADREPPPLPRELGEGATPPEELALDADDEQAIAGAWDRWRERMQGIEDGTRPLPLTRDWWINRPTKARRTLADMIPLMGLTDRDHVDHVHAFNGVCRSYDYFRLIPASLRPDLDRLMASPNGSDLP